MNANDYGCTFCNEFNGKKYLSYFENVYAKKYGIYNRCLFETGNIACVPTIGSFVKGYLLLIPKIHKLSFLSLPLNIFNEAQKIYGMFADYYQKCYNNRMVIFEHGSTNSTNVGGMSVLHAHQHVLPYNQQLYPQILQYDFLKFNSMNEAYSYYNETNSKNQKPYLLFQDVDGKLYLSFADEIPSQFFRNVICKSLGLGNVGDWTKYPFIENLLETIEITRKYNLKDKINNLFEKR